MSRKYLTPIVLPADPAAAMEAATKQYVDARAGSEVEINVNDPIGTNPNAELWYDIDAPSAASAAWTALPFAANWVNASGYSAGYRKIDDIVTLRGLAQRATSVTSGNVVIAQLPAGFYPPVYVWLVGGRNDGYTNLLSIDPAGAVTFISNGARATLAVGEWISLNQISYSVTA